MKRIKYSKLFDIIVVNDPAKIRALLNDPRVDRIFDRRPLLNGLLLKIRLSVLSYRGNRFPHMVPWGDVARAERDNALWERFNNKAPAIAEGPDELEPLARWIREDAAGIQPGVLAQQVIGSFFTPNYSASAESWAAAVTISIASRSRNFPRLF